MAGFLEEPLDLIVIFCFRYGSPGAPSSSVLGRLPKNNTTSPTPAATAWTLRQVTIQPGGFFRFAEIKTNVSSRIPATARHRKLSI